MAKGISGKKQNTRGKSNTQSNYRNSTKRDPLRESTAFRDMKTRK